MNIIKKPEYIMSFKIISLNKKLTSFRSFFYNFSLHKGITINQPNFERPVAIHLGLADENQFE